MKIKQKLVTPATISVFVIVALSGVLMFFSIKDIIMVRIHEYLGLAFVVIVIFHILANLKQFNGYFTKKSTLVVMLSIIFITLACYTFIPKDIVKLSAHKVMFNKTMEKSIKLNLEILDINNNEFINFVTKNNFKFDSYDESFKGFAKQNGKNSKQMLQSILDFSNKN